MTQKEKQLLLQDLSARLPYGVMCHANEINLDGELLFINKVYSIIALYNDKAIGKFNTCPIADIKPYLRQLYSMTEEEKEELKQISNDYLNEWENAKTSLERWKLDAKVSYKRAVFYNSHHFDWNDLIPMGLALEAPKGMYEASSMILMN